MLGNAKHGWLACVLVTLLPAGAAAQHAIASQARAEVPSDVAHAGGETAYQRVKTLAVREWQIGHWAEARALFLLAHGFRPSARTLRAIGMTAFELRLYPEAVRELSAALIDARDPLDLGMRREVSELLAQAEAYIVRYEVRLEPPHARLRVDGGEPRREPDGALILAVGTHKVEVEAQDYLSLHRDLVVPNDQGNLLSFHLSADGPTLPEVPVEKEEAGESKLEPLATKHWFKDYPRTWSAAGGSVMLGATALALYLGARHVDEQTELRCANDCDPARQSVDELTQQRDRLTGASYAALGGAAVLAVASIALFFYERELPEQARVRAGRPGGVCSGITLVPSALALRF